MIGITLSSTAAADEASDALISCWDQSFAYSLIGVRRDGGTVHVHVASQDERISEPLLPAANLGWGRAQLDMFFPATSCLVDEDLQVFRCAGAPASLSARLGRAPHGTVTI